MGYVLLWVENLTLWLLLTALLLACVGRVRRRWLRHALWAPMWMALFLPLALVTANWLSGVRQHQDWAIPWLAALLAWLAAFAVGSSWLWIRGLRRVETGAVPTVAGGWRRARLAAACVVILALHLMTFWNLDLAARQQLAALRCEAGVIGLSAAPPRVPDRDNAAILYLQAFKLMGDPADWPVASPEWYRMLDDSGRNWFPDDDLPELRHFVGEMRPAIRVLRQAAARPGCYFEHDYRCADRHAQLPELRAMASASKLLAVDARIHTLDGRFHEVIEDINTLFAMSGHANSEPSVIAISVSTGIVVRAVDATERLLSSNKIEVGDLTDLYAEDVPDYRGLLERSLRFEEASQLTAFCEVGSGELGLQKLISYQFSYHGGRGIHELPPEGSPILDAILGAAYRVFLLRGDLANCRRNWQECREVVGLPYDQASGRLDYVRERMRHHSGLLSNFFPSVGGVGAKTIAIGESQRQLARLGLAAYRYRAKHGRFPEKADDLVPDFIAFVPIDPFDDKPLQMKRTEHGLTIWSCGQDLADDGGTPRHLDRSKGAFVGDIAFELTDAAPSAAGKQSRK